MRNICYLGYGEILSEKNLWLKNGPRPGVRTGVVDFGGENPCTLYRNSDPRSVLLRCTVGRRVRALR
jgi:hypothetical protein